MLAKQVWRILEKSETLAAKVLKERYFKKSSIMQAGPGFNPSYLWRSLCKAREICGGSETGRTFEFGRTNGLEPHTRLNQKDIEVGKEF